MSKFKTSVAVDVQKLLRALPKDSAVHEIILRDDLSHVDVVWENDRYKTPHTFPVEWPDLSKVPDKVLGLATSGTSDNSNSQEKAPAVEARKKKNR